MAGEPKDPYQVLGVARTASQDEIKNAYRALAKKFHPDLNPGKKEAETKFKEISVAYELVGTPENRAKYDRGEFNESPFGNAGGPGPGGRPFYYYETQGGPEGPGEGGRYSYSFGNGGDFDEDLFEQFFRGRGAGKMAGEDRLYRMEVELREAALGAEKEISLPNGKKLSVKIPAGVTDGMRLRFAGQGDPGIRGGPSGDAYVEIHVRADPRFRREGDDLVAELPISLSEAVLGAEVRSPTLEGAVQLKIPPGSNTGKRLRLTGKGIFNRRTKKRGDLFVILQIRLPETIDPELESFVRNWAKSHTYDPRRGATP